VYTPEYGEEIHSAIVAVQGDNREITHRLWRGQAALLLPLIDRTRMILCEQLSASYGDAWPSLVQNPESGLCAELGAIEVALTTVLTWNSERDRWLRVVKLARHIRNNLAHYEPISYEDFALFWQLNVKVHQLLPQSVRAPA
jgi:hypothetical protein